MNQKYAIAAKPTRYRGVIYRSKLEAKWAAYFKALGWDACYEETFLKGWFPDFTIRFEEGLTFVEVKPYERLDQFEVSGTIKKIVSTMSQCSEHSSDAVLLLGKAPFNYANGGGPQLGWGSPVFGISEGVFRPARFCRNDTDILDYYTVDIDNRGVDWDGSVALSPDDLEPMWRWNSAITNKLAFETVSADRLLSVDQKYQQHRRDKS